MKTTLNIDDELLGRAVNFPLGRYIALYTMELKLARHQYDSNEIIKRGYFNVREVLFNTVYALGLEALGTMFDATGNPAKAESFRTLNKEVEKAILDECHDTDTGLYYDVDVNTNNLSASRAFPR